MTLVIFQEPNAYISPTHYETTLHVPTWNYVTVHAYGTARIMNDPDKVKRALESTIDSYDQAYREQWASFPEEYKARMAGGSIAFEILVSDLQGKKKLSQNRTLPEQQNIIASLSNRLKSTENQIADYMKANNKNEGI